MTSHTLIGEVVAEYLKSGMTSQSETTDTAFVRLELLKPSDLAGIANAIFNDPVLKASVPVFLPRHLMLGQSVPEACLTDLNVVEVRNFDHVGKSLVVMVNCGDDKESSVETVWDVGERLLIPMAELWVKVLASRIVDPDPLTIKILENALKGLRMAEPPALTAFAEYALAVAKEFSGGGNIIEALGVHLPLVDMPTFRSAFGKFKASVTTLKAPAPSSWKREYERVLKKVRCYYLKQHPTGAMLAGEQLQESLTDVTAQESLPNKVVQAFQAFIDGSGSWNDPATQRLANDFDYVEDKLDCIFNDLKVVRTNLGDETIEFFDHRCGQDQEDVYRLSKKDRTYLKALSETGTTAGTAEAEDLEFFERMRSRMNGEGERLRAKWEKFVFPAELECADFTVGVAKALGSLLCRAHQGGRRRVIIRCTHDSDRSLSGINVDAGQFFITRYQGFISSTSDLIDWQCAKLLEFRAKCSERGKEQNQKTSKSAMRIRFTIHVRDEDSMKEETMRLNWIFDDSSAASRLHSDLERLSHSPFTYCFTSLSSSVTTGRSKPLNLLNIGTLEPAFGQLRGSFVPRENPRTIEKDFLGALNTVAIPPENRELIRGTWNLFSEKYCEAIQQVHAHGFENADLVTVANTYGEVLRSINSYGKGDRVRSSLLKPVLSIGTVGINATKMLAIVTPWHPLRLAAIKLKTDTIREIVQQIQHATDVRYADKGLLAADLEETLQMTWFPEIAVCWRREEARVLCQVDHSLDYSAYECPQASIEADADSNDDPESGAKVLRSVVDRYLKLYPHERDSLSAVLYNCDSALLPTAAVKALSNIGEDDEPVRCQVILRHRVKGRLRDVYEKIIDAPENNPDALVISEVTEDFMARLRIEIHIDEVGGSAVQGMPPHDIVFLQDVVARNCEFMFEPHEITTLEWQDLKPSHFGRRRPLASEDSKTVTYLVSPAQARAGWDYITAIYTLHARRDWDGSETRRYIPQRELTFDTVESNIIFEEAHKLGNWVVNYDSVLDRRMLSNRGIKVIRFKQASSNGRNIIISSKASFALLEAMVETRLREILFDLSSAEIKTLAKQMLDDANAISGDLALRAARRSVNAGELIGVVLSAFLARDYLGTDQSTGWFFVDDYAEWLGQKEGSLADLLAIRITASGKSPLHVDILVTEAKYVSEGVLSDSRSKSKEQVLQTTAKLYDALIQAPSPVDRPAWLAKLGEMVVGGIPFSLLNHKPADIEGWRDAIVTGRATFNVVGLSHVFCSTINPQNGGENYLALDLKEAPRCFQEEFGWRALKDVILAYGHHKSYKPGRLPELTKALAVIPKPTDKNEGGDAEPTPQTPSPEPLSPRAQLTPIPPPEQPTQGPEICNHPWRSATVAAFIEQNGQLVGDSEEDRQWLEEVTQTCQRALQRLGMDAISAGIPPKLTPNAALVRFKGTERLTTPKVRAKTEELLTQFGLDIMAVQSEPLRVCISIARPKRAILKLLDVWKSIGTDKLVPGGFEIPIAVREDNGEILVLKPTSDDMPHTLIAGESNSGKSVLIRNILLAIACVATPDEAKITVIDAKLGVDFLAFEGLPHLTGPVITTQEESIQRLTELVTEMERRYRVLAKNRVENIVELHKLPNPTEHMPVLWVIHDEFADWMSTEAYRDEVPQLVSRLGMKARGAGIYLVFAAQRPDNQVMPMQLRDNLGNKLCLKVNSIGGGEIVLGMKNSGAERLLGKGHMLAKLPRSSDPIYCQVPFVDREEVREIVRLLGDVGV
jgi:S-DNA-T family DNA segregation ATPase FtsK/SpoIIIE